METIMEIRKMRKSLFQTKKDRSIAPSDSTFHYHRALYSVPEEQTYPRLLLIDSDVSYTSCFTDCVESLNFEIKIINDFFELTIFNKEKFDIIIIDYDINLSHDQDISSILFSLFGPVPIILTSSTNNHYSEKPWQFEFYDFMHKSLGANIILDAALEAHEWWKLNNTY